MGDNRATSEQTVIFVHIPKTAGTTLCHIMDQNLPRDRIYTIWVDGSMNDFKNLGDSQRAHIRLLRGHAGFGLHRFLSGPCAYFTMLRDPIERTISHYYHVRRTPQHFSYSLINTNHMSLKEFVESRQDPMVDNAQTRLLSGLETGYEIEFGQCTRGMLETAKANLREHSVVGLTEEFDAMLILLKKAFGWRKLVYARRNIGLDRLKRPEIPPATLEAVARVNSLDAELYEYARTLFEEQVRQQGASFAQEVRDFQVINQRLRPFVRLYWEAKIRFGQRLASRFNPWTRI